MARKRFKSGQIVGILGEGERGADRRALFREYGICEIAFYRRRRMYGGPGVSEVQRLKVLEEENRRQKQLAGGPALVIETIKEQPKQRG